MDGINDGVGYLKDEHLRVLVQLYKKLCGYVRISSLGRNIEEVVNKGSSILAIVQGPGLGAALTSTPHPRMETPNFGDISAIQSFREDVEVEDSTAENETGVSMQRNETRSPDEVEDSIAENETEVSMQMNETRNPDDWMKRAQRRNNSPKKDYLENENEFITITEDLDLLDEYEILKPEEAIQLYPNEDKLMGKEENITKKDEITENVKDLKVDIKLHRGLKLGKPHPPSNVGKGKIGIKLTRKNHTLVTKKMEEKTMTKSKRKLVAKNSTDVKATFKKPKKVTKRRRMSIFEVFPENNTTVILEDVRRPSMRRAAKKIKLSMEDSQDDIEDFLTDQNGNTSRIKRKPKTPAKKAKIESKKMTPSNDSMSGKGRKRRTRLVFNFLNARFVNLQSMYIITMQV